MHNRLQRQNIRVRSVIDRTLSVNLHPAYPKQQTLNEKGDGTLLTFKYLKNGNKRHY